MKSKLVLIVEDNAVIRMLLVEVLIEANFGVLEAEDANSALAILDSYGTGINLLMTDVHMPGLMDGLMLTHHVFLHWPSIGLLIVSGRARPAGTEMPLGARFMSKPYDHHHLLFNARQLTSRM